MSFMPRSVTAARNWQQLRNSNKKIWQRWDNNLLPMTLSWTCLFQPDRHPIPIIHSCCCQKQKNGFSELHPYTSEQRCQKEPMSRSQVLIEFQWVFVWAFILPSEDSSRKGCQSHRWKQFTHAVPDITLDNLYTWTSLAFCTADKHQWQWHSEYQYDWSHQIKAVWISKIHTVLDMCSLDRDPGHSVLCRLANAWNMQLEDVLSESAVEF